MDVKITIPSKNELREIKKLYKIAFPSYERKPFRLMKDLEKERKMKICSIKKDNEFCGLAIFVFYKDMVLLDYFAIKEKFRENKVGSIALKEIMRQYYDKRFFLEIESPFEKSNNKLTREKRKAFYLKNGMTETNLRVYIFSTEMELLTDNCKIEFEEYRDLYRSIKSDSFVRAIKKV